MNRKKIIAAVSLLLALLLIIGFTMFYMKRETHRILVIHSYDSEYALYKDFNDKITDQFNKNDIDADIRTLYLDCERYSEKPEILRMKRLISETLADGWKPDLIIVNNDQATYSLLKSEHPITRQVPIVFGGVEYPNYKLLRNFQNITGFVDKIDVMRNLEFIKRIMGNSVAIYTPLDHSFLGRKVIKDVNVQLKGQHVAGRFTTPELKGEDVLQLNEKHGYTIYDSYNIMDETKNKSEVIRWIPQIRVFNRNFYKSNDGESLWLANMQLDGVAHLIYKYDKYSELLVKTSPNPIFTASNKGFGVYQNVVGGYMTTLYMEVDDVVDLSSRILKGESIKKDPITQSSKMYAVDWNAIKFFKINPGRLPETCIIINRPFKERYPLAWYISIGSIAVVIIIIFALYYREVRKRRKINILMKQQHNMLKSSLYAAKAFAWVMEDGYITIDDSFWLIHGKKPRKISLNEFRSMMRPEQRHLLDDARIRKNNQGGKILQAELSLDKMEYNWWESRYFLSEHHRHKNAYYGLSFNIDATKKREKELEELRRLAEKAEMKQSFLENINHEIRTPLNAITGFSQILATDNSLSKEEKEKYLSFVERNNEKLLQIIDNILLISQLESGEIKMNIQPINVKVLLNKVFGFCEDKFAKNIRFIREDINNCECYINGDKKHTETAIRHLVENALKFTNNGYVKIGYKCNSSNETVEIYVEDTGCGIGTYERKLIFNQFYKRNRFGEGTGLGLTITKLIIEKQDGRIDLISEKGKGSRFSVKFPCFSKPSKAQK
jgi:signal transduction histidine kinase